MSLSTPCDLALVVNIVTLCPCNSKKFLKNEIRLIPLDCTGKYSEAIMSILAKT